MKHWFHGHVQGHYVGTPGPPSDAGRGRHGQHFHFEIYRAIVRNIQLVASEAMDDLPQEDNERSQTNDGPPQTPRVAAKNSHHHDTKGPALHQEHIGQVYLIDALGPGRTVRGAAFDIRASELNFEHSTRHQGKTYGRVEGLVSGWFREPENATILTEIDVSDSEKRIWSSEVLRNEEQPHPRQHKMASIASSESRDPSAPVDPNLPPAPKPLAPQEAPDLPFFTLGAAIALLLALGATPASAGIGSACFLPAWALRKWLHGVIASGKTVNLFSALLGIASLIVSTLSVAHWSTLGCKELGNLSLLFLVAALQLSSLLPGRTSFALCCASLALIILGYYSSIGPNLC